MTLANAQQAFDAGDFASARRLAKALLKDEDAATRDGAIALLRRTAFDPVVGWMALGCALFFIIVVVLAVK